MDESCIVTFKVPIVYLNNNSSSYTSDDETRKKLISSLSICIPTFGIIIVITLFFLYKKARCHMLSIDSLEHHIV